MGEPAPPSPRRGGGGGGFCSPTVLGIFVKLVDCKGYLVNLTSTEYRLITEKFKGVFIKLMDFRIILTKSKVFFTKFTEYGTITKSLGFFL